MMNGTSPNHGPGPNAAWSTEDWKREFAEILFSHKRIIFLTGLLVLLGALAVVRFWPPTYRAQAHVMVQSTTPTSRTRMMRVEQGTQQVDETYVTSERVILESPELIRRTLMAMREAGEASSTEPGPDINKQVRSLQGQMEATVVPSSQVVRVSFYSQDPEFAEEFMDTLMSTYLAFRDEKFTSPEEAQFLAERAEMYRKQMEEIDQQIVEKSTEAGNVALVDHAMANNSDLQTQLERRLRDLQAEYARQEESLKPLKEALEDDEVQFFAFLGNESMAQLVQELAMLVVEMERAEQRYEDDAQEYLMLKRQVQNTYARLRKEAQRLYQEQKKEHEGTKAAIESLKASVEEIGERNVELNKKATEIRWLQNRAEMLEDAYRTFLEKREALDVNAAVTDVAIINNTATGAEIAYPKPVPTILIGIAAALIVGLSFGCIAEYLDQAIHRPTEVHRYLNLPVICSIEEVK